MIFSVRQIRRKYSEQHMDLNAGITDLTKAFDTVNMEALWITHAWPGCPRYFTNLIRLFHDGMKGLVVSTGDASTHFETTDGVKEGCVRATILFNLFFTCVRSLMGTRW